MLDLLFTSVISGTVSWQSHSSFCNLFSLLPSAPPLPPVFIAIKTPAPKALL